MLSTLCCNMLSKVMLVEPSTREPFLLFVVFNWYMINIIIMGLSLKKKKKKNGGKGGVSDVHEDLL